jgi:hypothetical protein
MPRTNGAFDIRAEHPKRVHVNRQMKEIRVKEAARDQLPQLKSDLAFELGHGKMANGPEREGGEKARTGNCFQQEDGDVCAEQQFC